MGELADKERQLLEAFLASKIAREFRPWRTPEGVCPQQEFLQAAAKGSYRVFRGGNRAQPVDEPVLTPCGWRAIGELAPGDEVIGGDGQPTRVGYVYPQGERDAYRVWLSDGRWTRSTADHLWPVTPYGDDGPAERILTLWDMALWTARHGPGSLGVRVLDPPSARAALAPVQGISRDGRAEAACISVEAEHGTYVTREGIVTHNSGKSTALAVDSVLRVCGWHPFVRQKPPVHGWLSALDCEWGIGQVLWPAVRKWLPWSEVRSAAWLRKGSGEHGSGAGSIPLSIAFKNGSQLDFKSSEAGASKYQGVDLDFAGCDEEHPQDVAEEIRARLLRRRGDFAMALTPLRRERWVMEFERNPGVTVIRASTYDAARAGVLDEQAVKEFAATLPDRQLRVRYLGDFAALDGLVYPEFDRQVHVVYPEGNVLRNARGDVVAPWPIPADWPRYAAMDFGFSHPAAVPVAACDPDSDPRMLVIERCYHAANVRTARWAVELQRVLPPLATPLVCDHDADGQAELQAAGIRTTQADKRIITGIEAVERYMHPIDGKPRLYIVIHKDSPPWHPVLGRCDGHALGFELEGYRYPPTRKGNVSDARDLPLKKDDDANDAVRYLVMQLEARGFTAVDIGSIALAQPGLAAATFYGASGGLTGVGRTRLGQRRRFTLN